MSNSKQPPNGTNQAPKATPTKQQTSAKKIVRVFSIGIFAAVVGAIGLFLHAWSAFAQAVPGQSEAPIFANTIASVVVSVCALLLFADEVNVRANPRVMKVVGLGLGFYAFAQSLLALFILWWG